MFIRRQTKKHKEFFKRNLFITEEKVSQKDIKEFISEGKNFVYELKKTKKTMEYFNRWQRSKLRDKKIIYHPGVNISKKKTKKNR